MDARILRNIAAAAALLLTLGLASNGVAAGFRTQNFIVQAPTPALAKAVGESAERYRDELAEYWLGRRLPAWPTPCPIHVVAGAHLAAQGVTTYNRAPVRDFQMEVVGTPERILDSVLPHEVTHTVLATHFGRPLPRWADEGICTTVEHEAERSKHEAKLREFLNTRRGIAMNRLFLLTEYPSDVLPMYAQGYSVCQFLIGQQDARAFIRFLQDYMQHPSWTENVRKHYGYNSLADLQENWLAWVAQGSGPVGKFAGKQGPATRPDIAQVSAVQDAGRSGSLAGQSISRPGNEAGSLNRGGASQPVELNEPARGTALAAISSRSPDQGNGWYQRKKAGSQPSAAGPRTAPGNRPGLQGNLAMDQIQPAQNAAGNAGRSPAITPMVPPSVRNSGRYSSAQPQPQMQMSRNDLPYVPSNRWSAPQRY